MESDDNKEPDSKKEEDAAETVTEEQGSKANKKPKADSKGIVTEENSDGDPQTKKPPSDAANNDSKDDVVFVAARMTKKTETERSKAHRTKRIEENGDPGQTITEKAAPEEKAAGEAPETQADSPQPSQTLPRRMRLRPTLKPRSSVPINVDHNVSTEKETSPLEKEATQPDEPSEKSADVEANSRPSSVQISDEDSDAMVDDPNDEDFVPFRTVSKRPPTRLSLRNQIPPRPPKPALTKMSCAHCRTPLQKGQTAYQRKGLPQLFCSSTCLTTFSKKPLCKKICTFCKKDIRNSKDSVVAQTGSGFQEFCSNACLSLYEAQPRSSSQSSSDVPDIIKCSICHKSGERTSPEGGIHLNCHYCHNMFTGKPEILDWQDHVYQFCCKDCCEDYKRLHGVVSQCEYCKQEKILHEKIRFSGVEKNFCSEGCVLLYKQDFTKNLGLCCITCTYCSQTCQRAVTEELDGSTWDFCSEECKSKYLLWYFKKSLHERTGADGLILQGQNAGTKPPASTQIKTESNAASPKPSSPQTSPAPPPPPSPSVPRKNKAAMCKPLMQNRGVSCRVEMKSKDCQTDEDYKPQIIILPIPVPIFVPVPMNLYSQKVPVPFSLPVPVPVPLLLPTTLENTDKIVETIEELKVKIPSNPLEADILAMAEMIAEAEGLDKSSDLCELSSDQSAEGLLEDCDLFGSTRDDVLAMAVKMANVLDQPGQDLEADFPKNSADINQSVDFLLDCGLVSSDEASEQDAARAVRKGAKRMLLSEKESSSRDSLLSQRSSTNLSFAYGVNAWKSWVQRKYEGGEPSKGEEIRFGPKPMRIKEDILACTAAELNYGLAQFVKEITRPNGERYEPDSIYYLCLGIQQYLLENNRMVNIFTDLYYLTFVQELNKILTSWHRSQPPNKSLGKRKRDDDQQPLMEQHENKMNPLRCPVKFYEFYLSKCPESLRNRSDVFYLQPERSCVAESPLWYSVIPMDKNMLQSMLSRILAVREVYEEQLRGGSIGEDTD
ncbi:hypothetical protein GDO78_013140 [Eleutherodactylus coqui]|uniref:TRASH domain-containing protein n=1 Tax=Eleutherodactylus coqui TaxID=57060 RepID=A0A8J6EZV7_ELECQ|nr:hypothetical protein GDO78_013140 [Eleutherodactylus coqui]